MSPAILDPVSSLPPLYTAWIEEILDGPVPEERHATCSACAMCLPNRATAATANVAIFDPSAKCCTYVPTLPNFLVGFVLNDDDPAAAIGRATIENRIAAGIGVTPLGLQPGAHQALIHKHAGRELFGRPSGIRCPHYLADEDGRCGIWRHRNAVCATWFCKFERGKVGKQFWDAVLQVLTIAERHLALWAAIELGEPVGKLSPALLTYFATTTHHHTSDWTERWAGWPAEFYRACGRLVEALSWMQVREIGGAELALLAGQVRARHDAMGSDEVPTYLRLGAVGAIPRDDGGCALSGYSPNDMLVLPRRLAGALESFDGSRTTAQACADIAGETGVTLDKAAVRRLVDFGILQEMPTLEGSGCSGL